MNGDRPIRILHSVGHLARGGIETWLLQMIRRLDPALHEHHILVWTEEEEPFTQAFRDAGARIIPCLNRSNPLKLVRNLRRILATDGPYDLLHTHGTHFQGFVMAAARSLGVQRFVAHSHNDIRSLLQRRSLPQRLYARAGYALMRHNASLGLGVSEKAAECAFGEHWQQDPRYQLLYCGVDFRSFFCPPDSALRSRLGIPEGVPVIGHVGRYVAQKNHAFIVEVAAELHRRNAPTHFLLIGDGPLRPLITQQLRDRGLLSRFTIVPDTTEVAQYLVGAMDSFIFPSLYEGVGLAAVEAQAAGLPAIVSSTIPLEVIVNSATARSLSLEAGPSAWADALERLPPRQSSLDPGFQQLFLQSRFNVESGARRLRDHYAQLVTG